MKRLICLILCAAACVCILASCQKEQTERAVVMETENFKITEDLFQYYMNLNLSSFYAANSAYFQYMNFDITKPLRSQTLGEGSEETWFDYFAENTKKSVAEDLLLAEYAKEMNCSLDDGDREEIEKNVKSLEEQAKEAGRETDEYIKANLGSLISADTVRKVYEIHLLAEKGRAAVNASFDYTDEELEKYLNDNYSDFYTADYLTLTVGNRETPVGLSADELEKSFEKAYETAVKINNSVKDKESFLSAAEDYYRSVYTVVKEKPDDAEEGVISEEELSSLVFDCIKEKAPYKKQDSTDALIFSEDRAAGEHFIIEDKEMGNCTLYFILSPVSLDDGPTVTLRNIFLSSEKHEQLEKDAQNIVDEWTQKGQTEDMFAYLAAVYGEDASKQKGGLVECAGEDEMDEAVAKWCFDLTRKEGDCTMINADGGIHILYFKSRAETGWKEQARLAMSEGGYNEKLESLSETHPVTVYGDLISQMPEIVSE